MKLSAAELEMLSPEERAGIEDKDPITTAGEPETTDEAPPVETKPTADADPDPDADPEANADEDPPAEAAAKPAKEAAPATVVDEDEHGEPVIVAPMLKEEAPRDWAAERTALRTKYDEGDLSQDEYDNARDELTRSESRATTARDINQATREAKWEAEQGVFFGQYKQFSDSAKPGLRAALDVHVARIDAESKGTLSGYQLLQQARQAVNAELGLVPAKNEPKEPGKEPGSKSRPVITEADAQNRALKNAPKTLADIPPAEDADAGQEKYAHLDALANKGGMAFEKALASLSEADRAEYLGQ